MQKLHKTSLIKIHKIHESLRKNKRFFVVAIYEYIILGDGSNKSFYFLFIPFLKWQFLFLIYNQAKNLPFKRSLALFFTWGRGAAGIQIKKLV